MASAASMTIAKMLETLPEPLQEEFVEHAREYIEERRDEVRWTEAFGRTQGKPAEAARQARHQIAAGKARPLSLEQL